jgi:MoaA/NifB/PqqE/SkfB family radical SAM enzyme
MIEYQKIRQVHLEISSRCNASCPECPRNLRGAENIIDDYPVCDMTLEQAQKIFQPDFVRQLNGFLINGNYGDFVTARDGLAIVEYLLSCNPKLAVSISTNGSGQPKIWSRLGELGIHVMFRIEGLEDTHKLYRQGTDYQMIMNNAQKFIDAGGVAEWRMIDFDFNKNLHDAALLESIRRGFKHFEIVDHGRNNTAVFTPKGEYSHTIGDQTLPQELYFYYNQYKSSKNVDLTPIYRSQPHKIIDCHAKKASEIYVAANGEVYPCCWTGFYPRTNTRKPGNDQLLKILKDQNNNALEVGLESAIAWFAALEDTWRIQEVQHGRSHICNGTCGTTSQ